MKHFGIASLDMVVFSVLDIFIIVYLKFLSEVKNLSL